MFFDSITPAPPDSILGLTEAFKKDTHPRKVNLGVGVFVDDQGKTPVLPSVKQAERILLQSEQTKSYLPISGSPEYGRCVQELVLGGEHPLVHSNRAQTAQTPGGTGGLRVGADFLKKFAPSATVWLSAPTWPNHRGIFSSAGFRISEYPYYDSSSRALDFEGMRKTLETIPENDIVLLHVCCHNPTGVDLTQNQWQVVAEIAKKRRWIPFFDFAYQGFGDGLIEDRYGLMPMLETGLDVLISSSFSKNFGLYNERVGALTIVSPDAEGGEAAFSHIKSAIRVLYSNPPSHGGAIVATVLKDQKLRLLWEKEVESMRGRIARIREAFVEQLRKRNAPMDFSFIKQQKGMFSFSGLNDVQVSYLREKKSIYMVAGGRINVAGILPSDMDYICDSIIEALSL